MIGKYLVDLPNLASEANHEGSKGVLPNCQMKCDAMPCKNLGTCTEDFGRQESSCNCELTSYFGEHCADGKLNCYVKECMFKLEPNAKI